MDRHLVVTMTTAPHRRAMSHTESDDDGASITEALAAAHRLLDECGPQLGAHGDMTIAPREITASVYRMIARHGLQQVRSAQRAIGDPHPALNHIFHEVVQWKVRGYDQ